MAYKRSKQKTSLSTIEKSIKEELAKISSYEIELAKCRAELLLAPPVSEIEKKLVKATLSQLDVRWEDIPRPIPFQWMHRFLGGVEKHGNEYYNRELYAKYEDNCSKLDEFKRGELYTRYYRLYQPYSGIYPRIRDYEARIESSRSTLLRLEEAARPMRKKKDSLIELRAAAALNAKETREIGATVRRGLTRQPWCPYCGGSLGSDLHADHIYPVSKGGRSVPKNMVYACAQCNFKKTNLTLTGFIKKFSLDRDAIEERLKQLHKDF